MKWLVQELNLLALCASFFTRLPLPKQLDYSDEKMHRAGRYFSLIGIVLAVIVSGFVYAFSSVIPIVPALVLALMASLLSTGAFHEDGLADTFDAFWGGMTKERKLAIMKDSRLGTYGVSALVLTLGLKITLWYALWDVEWFYAALFVGYPLSRAMALSLIQDMPYARAESDNHSSKSGPLAQPLLVSDLWVLLTIAIIPAIFLLSAIQFCCLLFACFVVRHLLKKLFLHHVDGVTGDCLGAAQQIQEMSIYLILLIMVG